MQNTFKRILSCLSILAVCLMSQVGIEAKTASAPQITNILQNSDIVKNNDKKDFVLYDGSSLDRKSVV